MWISYKTGFKQLTIRPERQNGVQALFLYLAIFTKDLIYKAKELKLDLSTISLLIFGKSRGY